MICPFVSKLNMASSPMRNAEISIPSRLLTILDLWELSVSSEEKHTRMEEFISMLSSCSNGSLSHETSVYSMWMDATRMLCADTEHQRRGTIMRQKMGMWLQEDSPDQNQYRYLRLVQNGLRSSHSQLELSFLMLSRDWIHGHFALASPHWSYTPIGSTGRTPARTQHQPEYHLRRRIFQDSLNGFNEIWALSQVSVLSCPSLRRGLLLPPVAWPESHCRPLLHSRAPG